MKKTIGYFRNTQFRKNRKITIVCLVVGVIIALFILLELSGTINFFGNKAKNTTSDNALDDSSGIYKPATDQEKQEVENRKLSDNTQGQSNPPTDKEVLIISAEQKDTIRSIVVITKLTGSGWQSCKLTLSNNGNTFIKTSETIYTPEYSSCLGFSVPLNDFNSSGKWNITLSGITTDGKIFNSDTKLIEVVK